MIPEAWAELSERQQRVALRAFTGVLFAASMAPTNAPGGNAALRFLAAAGALLAYAGLAALWGDRTRPKANAAWMLLGLGVAGIVFYGTNTSPGLALPLVILPLSLLVAAFLVHDLHLTPTWILTAAVVSSALEPGVDWVRAAEAEAWRVATAVLLGVAAAAVERERLAAREGTPTPWAWTGVRLGFVAVWTIAVVALKEKLQVGQLFAVLGANPTGLEGQLLLLGILLAALALAIFLFKPPRASAPAPG